MRFSTWLQLGHFTEIKQLEEGEASVICQSGFMGPFVISDQVRGGKRATAQTVQRAPSGLRRRDGGRTGTKRESNGGGQSQRDALLFSVFLSLTSLSSVTIHLATLQLTTLHTTVSQLTCPPSIAASPHTEQHSVYLSAEHPERAAGIQVQALLPQLSCRTAASCHVVQPSRILQGCKARKMVTEAMQRRELTISKVDKVAMGEYGM